MKFLSGIFNKPLTLSIGMGLLVAFIAYYAGTQTLQHVQKTSDQELALQAHKVAEAFLMSELNEDYYLKKEFLTKAAQTASRHPRINSVLVRNASNNIVVSTYKNEGEPTFTSKDLTYPVQDATGRHRAQIVFELNNEPLDEYMIQLNKIKFIAIFGFLVGFGFSLIIFKLTKKISPELIYATQQMEAGNLDVIIPPGVESQSRKLSKALTQILEYLKERDRMKHSIGRIMDPKVAEALIQEDPKLGGRRRPATILFCDIRNYTSLCEELTHKEVQDFHNEYWKGTVEIIMEQDGHIDKFHGDGVLVVFGAPVMHEDDPLRAIRTAWRLVGNVAALNQRRMAQRKMPIEIGIGIHMGDVIAGHIGSERRMDYTVVGDVVNVAARIEELNKKFGTQILISDEVYEKVETCVSVKTLTLAHLRGHKRPILVHALKGFHDKSSDVPKDKAA